MILPQFRLRSTRKDILYRGILRELILKRGRIIRFMLFIRISLKLFFRVSLRTLALTVRSVSRSLGCFSSLNPPPVISKYTLNGKPTEKFSCGVLKFSCYIWLVCWTFLVHCSISFTHNIIIFELIKKINHINNGWTRS